eukprot:6069609-Prymnesium_polylepis.1
MDVVRTWYGHLERLAAFGSVWTSGRLARLVRLDGWITSGRGSNLKPGFSLGRATGHAAAQQVSKPGFAAGSANRAETRFLARAPSSGRMFQR